MDSPTVEEDCSIVAVVGEAMKDTPGIAGKVFGVLGEHGISICAIAQGSSELNISFVVRREEVETAVRVIHEAFFGIQSPSDSTPDSVPVAALLEAGPLDVVGLATGTVSYTHLTLPTIILV